MLQLGEALRKLALWRRGILLLALLLFVGVSLYLLPRSGKEIVASTALSSLFYPAQYVLTSVDDYRSIRAENARLKELNARLRLELDNAREGRQELVRLRSLVRFENKWEYPIVTAQVVGRNPGRFATTILLNRGESHGLKPNMPVFAFDGLVGRVSKVSAFHSQVQLLSDPTFRVSIIDTRTRTVGFAEPSSPKALSANVPAYAEINEGDTIATSGFGGIFPKGLVVGKVSKITREEQSVEALAEIIPFQDLNRLEEVFVLQKEPDWTVREDFE